MPRARVGNEWRATSQEAFFEGPIVRKYACTACHTVADRGGTVGPVLNNVGYRRSPEWLRNWLKEPNAVKDGTPMPQFPFSPEELEAAVRALSRMRLPMRTDDILREPAPPERKGEELFADFDCFACHRVGDKGHFIGPNLTWVGRRKSRGWEQVWLKDPPGFKPGTFMPNFHLPEQAIEALTAYLHSLQGQKNGEARGWEQRNAHFFGYSPAQRGKLVVDRLACAACHGDRLREGVPNPNAAPDGAVPAADGALADLTLAALRARVEKGAAPRKLDLAGPEPLYQCPSYAGALDDQDAANLLAYLKTLAPPKREWKIGSRQEDDRDPLPIAGTPVSPEGSRAGGLARVAGRDGRRRALQGR